MADLSIEFPRGTSPDTVQSVATELDQLDEVDETSAPTERSVIGAALLLVNVAGPALQSVATALPVVQKIVEALRGRGVTGATIELPDGTKISVDNASAEDIERILEAAKKTSP
jgi:ferric-dicitrate binding protein FerR (iron transport regulator)